MRLWQWGWSGPFAMAMGLVIGCAENPAKLRYLGDAALNYYKEAATEIDYAAVESQTVGEVMATEPPRAVNDHREDEIRELTLAEAINIALQNSAIIRSTAQLATPGNRVLSGPDGLPSIYDPAIQESGVLFGGRGLESALSAFDARWTTSMLWGRNEQVQNNLFASGGLLPGNTLTTETGIFSTRLQKLFADGGSFAVTQNWNYVGSDAPGQLFQSAYTGAVGAEYRLPLLAGAGTEYTRIAGPIANSFGGITGVNQGVVITRINNDITLADFELSVRNLMKDVEDAYWDLYLQYRLYDTAVKTRNSTLYLWRRYKNRLDLGADLEEGGTSIPAEAQAREQYYETRAAAATALGNIYRSEVQLRRLLGLTSNDGFIFRPSDEPPLAEFVPNWEVSLVEALTNRTELRRQKFNIKSLELQLQAANSLVRPRFDFVSGYRVNGFGDDLLSRSDGSTGYHSAYGSITQGDQTAWNLGFEMTMDLGFRSAHAQVRNVELRLAKARDILSAQELDVSHEVATTFQNVATNYATAQANFNRRRASERRVEVLTKRVQAGTTGYDESLRSQLSLAQAEAAFYTNLTDYAKSIAAFHFATGDLLEFNNVHLAESLWTPHAYDQALRRAMARSHALGNPFLHTEPPEFVYPEQDHIITVEPENSSPELETLPAELPARENPDWEQGGGDEKPSPLLPALKPIPAYEPPDPGAGNTLLPPTPDGNNSASDYQAVRSRNLARIMSRDAGSERPDNSLELSGTKVGALKAVPSWPAKPAANVEQSGFFSDSPATGTGRQEPLLLDPARDLLP